MLYLFYGEDSFRSRGELNKLINKLKENVGESSIFGIEADGFDQEQFEGLVKSNSLFGEKYLIICSRILQDVVIKDFIEKNLENIFKSQNIFIFWEDELEDSLAELFKGIGAKVKNFSKLTGVKLRKWIADQGEGLEVKISSDVQEKIVKKCGGDLWCASNEIERYSLSGVFEEESAGLQYNPFAICDAVANKNKKQAWLLLQKAIMGGIAGEEIFWKVVWQIKTLLLIKKLQVVGADVYKESGLKPFVIGKATRVTQNFTEEKLVDYSTELVDIYHQAHLGGSDIPIALEKFLLGM